MKLHPIAAAVAALGSSAAFAVCPPTTTVDTNPDPVLETCTIQPTTQTFYIAGASAQAQAFNAVAKNLFDVPNNVIQIRAGTTSVNSHVGYYGIRGGVKTLIVYRNSGGSGAGLRQLVSNTTGAYDLLPGANNENNALTLGTVTAVTGGSGTFVATSSTNTKQVPSLALLDLNFNEHANGVVPAPDASYVAVSALESGKTGLQGFGVVVNPALYTALQNQNTAEGKPLGFGGQPSIRRADYASLISVEGNIKTAADLLNDPADLTKIVVCRRADTSGTQAASNIFFLNNVSGLAGYGGALNSEKDPVGDVTYVLGSGTGDAIACLNAAGPEYRIGVVSLENVPPGGTWRFVAIDGVSPNATYDLGTAAVVADPKQRQQMAKGDYTFAFETSVANRKAASATVKALRAALVSQMADSTKSDLTGFAYQDIGFFGWNPYDSTLAAPANKQARGNRNANNSQPLVP
jgi:hypothetical protein